MTQVFQRRSDGFGDKRFDSFLARASDHGNQWFTRPQLYSAYAQRQARHPLLAALIGLLVASTVSGVGAMWLGSTAPVASAAALAAGIAAAVWRWRRARSGSGLKRFADFNKDLDRWIRIRGRPPKLLDSPGLNQPPPPSDAPDLYDYGVERLVIVDRDLLVDLLVNNGLASDWRALIVSANGYPRYLMPHVATLFADNPDLPVCLLHDSGVKGEGLHHTLLDHDVFRLRTRNVTDIGMSRNDHAAWPVTRRMSGKFGRHLPLDAMPLAVLGSLAPLAFADHSTLAEAQARHGAGAEGEFG